ncbi:putative toxin-antitoxin system toxin component, PIN family [Kiritimatiella glycovorans]|uniref:Putative toxin-antitoxin system toxin component, PIN family n=1 Tax=Kiritimatiella glycovorans TaxID=1307763 RepID=A0A0G3EFY8_9BACT|nr:putative toxin-antitoxin system toxin component, PIN family [Kiritimatiella glycovorans]AKJ63735.1 putative toxin-antitoxin system toxin component, PIN family [Kiritimatiella glycovorans]
MRAVIDTNVLISGMINPDGTPGRIVDMLRTGSLTAVIDDRIFTEYARVLRRPYFAQYFHPVEREQLVDYLRHNTECIIATSRCTGLPDPLDAPFLESALTSEVPLITGNLKHFPRSAAAGCRILTPKEFLESLDTSRS